MKKIRLELTIIILVIFSSCTSSENDNETNLFVTQIFSDPITDVDGNSYNTVLIGSQTWMQQNLDVSHYRNGDIIPQVQDPIEWSNMTIGAWCYYENNTDNGTVLGKLYNWYAINDPRGLAPMGYHVPSKSEWNSLIQFLGGFDLAGRKMKAISNLWENLQVFGATNSSGFTGLPGGARRLDGSFINKNLMGYWWSSTELPDIIVGNVTLDNPEAYLYSIDYRYNYILEEQYSKPVGFSVRCIRD
jgi:uncharacterized protein (TIGR02145 family)